MGISSQVLCYKLELILELKFQTNGMKQVFLEGRIGQLLPSMFDVARRADKYK
jgi:hypothetical protein